MQLRISFYECCVQMAESQKAISSAVDSKSKEKKSMLGIPVACKKIEKNALESLKKLTRGSSSSRWEL